MDFFRELIFQNYPRHRNLFIILLDSRLWIHISCFRFRIPASIHNLPDTKLQNLDSRSQDYKFRNSFLIFIINGTNVLRRTTPFSTWYYFRHFSFLCHIERLNCVLSGLLLTQWRYQRCAYTSAKSDEFSSTEKPPTRTGIKPVTHDDIRGSELRIGIPDLVFQF